MNATSSRRYGFHFWLIFCIYWNLKIRLQQHGFCHTSVPSNKSLDYRLQRLLRHKFITFQLDSSPDLTHEGEQCDFEKRSSAVYSPEMRDSLLGTGSEFPKASVQKLYPSLIFLTTYSAVRFIFVVKVVMALEVNTVSHLRLL